MKSTALAIGILSLVVMSGCGKQNTAYESSSASKTNAGATASASTSSPEELGAIGAEIKKHPGDANRILSAHGMTMASFEKAIRSVSSDPEQSRRYRDAYKKAGA